MSGGWFYDKRGGAHANAFLARDADRRYANEEVKLARDATESARRTADDVREMRRASEEQARRSAALLAEHERAADEAEEATEILRSKAEFDRAFAFLAVANVAQRIEYFLRSRERKIQILGSVFAAMAGWKMGAEFPAAAQARAELARAGADLRAAREKLASMKLQLSDAKELAGEHVDAVLVREKDPNTVSAAILGCAVFLGLMTTCLTADAFRSSRGAAAIWLLLAIIGLFTNATARATARKSAAARILDADGKVKGLPSAIEKTEIEVAKCEVMSSVLEGEPERLNTEALKRVLSDPNINDALARELTTQVSTYLREFPPNCWSPADEIRRAVSANDLLSLRMMLAQQLGVPFVGDEAAASRPQTDDSVPAVSSSVTTAKHVALGLGDTVAQIALGSAGLTVDAFDDEEDGQGFVIAAEAIALHLPNGRALALAAGVVSGSFRDDDVEVGIGDKTVSSIAVTVEDGRSLGYQRAHEMVGQYLPALLAAGYTIENMPAKAATDWLAQASGADSKSTRARPDPKTAGRWMTHFTNVDARSHGSLGVSWGGKGLAGTPVTRLRLALSAIDDLP